MDDVERVKQKVDIADLLGEYITLKKTGQNFKANCPFHNEKSPSFVVSPDRQIWHCFGCGKGGDVFTFLEEYDHIGFGEALKFLANKVGVKLTAPVFKDEIDKKRDVIYSLNILAANFYHYLLTEHTIGKDALSYLTDTRKLPLPLIKKFNLGYAPGKSLLTQFLTRKKGYAPQDLVDAGIAAQKDRRTFDFFRDRVMFPLYDPRGNIIAFSGRALDDSLPKYINNKETIVYRKGDTLFGLFFAKDAIKQEGKVILVEGEFDVISAFHEGISNIVAIKGTALTENQIKILKRYATKISFCFDTDPAGTAAQRRSIELIEKEGVAASVIIPPHGKDPDELLRENPAEFKKAIKNEVNIFDFIINSAMVGKNPSSADDKRVILEKTLPILMKIDNEVIKEHYLKKLADILQVSLESLIKQGEKTLKTTQTIQAPIQSHKKNREDVLEEYLLSLLFQSQKPQEHLGITMTIMSQVQFSIPAYNRLFRECVDSFRTNPALTMSDFAKTVPTELLEVFDRAYLAPLPPLKDEKEYEEEVKKTAKEVRLLTVKNKLKELTDRIREKEGKAPESEVETLQEEFKNLTSLLHQKGLD